MAMKKLSIDPSQIDHALIKQAVRIIAKGGIAALPTETVYGLGCRSDKSNIVDKLYAIKQRSKDKPFSLALHSISDVISNYFDTLPPFGYRLIERFWPGPLTLIYYTPEGKTIGIRVPCQSVTSEILRELKVPLCFPSANLSGDQEAVTASEVEANFSEKIDLLVDSGKCIYSKPSTIVDLTLKPFKVAREGVIGEKDIAAVFFRKRILFICTGNSCRSPMAEFLLQKYLAEERIYFNERYEIISAGISATNDMKAAPAVVNILKDKEENFLQDGEFRSIE